MSPLFCSTGRFLISRLVEFSPKSQMKVLAAVSASVLTFLFCCWCCCFGSLNNNNTPLVVTCLPAPRSSHLCSVPPWWSHFWHWYGWFPNQDLGFEGTHQRGQLPRPLRPRHLHCILREWILSGHRLELLTLFLQTVWLLHQMPRTIPTIKFAHIISATNLECTELIRAYSALDFALKGFGAVFLCLHTLTLCGAVLQGPRIALWSCGIWGNWRTSRPSLWTTIMRCKFAVIATVIGLFCPEVDEKINTLVKVLSLLDSLAIQLLCGVQWHPGVLTCPEANTHHVKPQFVASTFLFDWKKNILDKCAS